MNLSNLKYYAQHALALLMAVSALFGTYGVIDQVNDAGLFGSGYNPVTGYQSRTTSYVTGSATTIPVASTKDPAGNQIVLSNISSSSTVKVYFNIEPGTSREEAIVCTGVTPTSWTGCTRGLSFQGSSETGSSTLQFAHNAGSPIVMTNISQFYNEFVAIDGNQNIGGIKTFTVYPKFSATTTVPTLGAEFATKYYVDAVGAGGFTAANVSTTRGLSVDGSIPERVGINLGSATTGLAFLDSGPLYINALGSGGIDFDSSGRIRLNPSLEWTSYATWTFPMVSVTGTPAVANNVTNKGYVDTAIVLGTATGTAGEAITAGRALYMGSTSTLFHTNTTFGTTTSTSRYVGIAQESVASGSVVRYTVSGHTNCNQSGLSAGGFYYLNGTAGQLDQTPNIATSTVRVGHALTANCLLALPPKFALKGVFATTTGIGSAYIHTGFYPAQINFRTAQNGAGTCDGFTSHGDDNNTSVFSYDNAIGVSGQSAYDLDSAFYMVATGPVTCIDGTVTKNPQGFTINIATLETAGTEVIEWWALSE